MAISWKRNFYTLWTAQLFAVIGFHAIQPFLAYYVQEFDVEDLDEALLWAGYLGSAAGFAMAISSPIWGAVADRFGRKSMVVRSMVGGGITVFFMAYAGSVFELLIARTLQGALAGTVTACITMVSTTTPKSHLGFAMGMMQGAFLLGAALGPLMGGPFIAIYGYKACFLASGSMVIFAGIAVQFLVSEDFRKIEKKDDIGQNYIREFFIDGWRLLGLRPFIITLVIVVLIQFAYGVIMPVVPLFLQYLSGRADILSEAGFVFSLMSLTGAISAAVIGNWTLRIGLRRLLSFGLLSTAILLVFQGSATSVFVFAVLYVLGGFTTGAVRPVANTIITYVISETDRGKAFGILTSAGAFGWALGPSVGAFVGSQFGFQVAFYVTAFLFLCVAVWAFYAMSELNIGEDSE
tara:strand:- start:2824 stop:4044 length:1221 start_codon:yes stop_codon:yes gene_type:complete